MRKHIINGRVIIHGILLLALCFVPFWLGMYKHSSLLVMLLLFWPAAAFLSPFLLALDGTVWYAAFAPVPIFLLLPLFALLTPAAMEYLGVYLFFYGLLALAGAFIGTWRSNMRGRRMPGKGLGMRNSKGIDF